MLIGVYRKKDPLRTLPSGRVQALIAEAHRQNVELFFFDAEGIDMDRQRIQGSILRDGNRIQRSFPLPDTVLNEWPESPKHRPFEELQLRQSVPFTTHLIHGKYEMYSKLQSEFGPFLLAQDHVSSFERLLSFIDEHDDVILKPENGRKGNHIYRVRFVDGQYIFHAGDQSAVVTKIELRNKVSELLHERDYMMQHYWPVMNDRGEPTDYRVHVQRGEDGDWGITKIYPRIGRKNEVVSNLSKGGSTEAIDDYLQRLYSDRAPEIKQQLGKLALRIAKKIDSYYHFMVDELGIDLLMNEKGEIRFLEANSGPETRNHEAERAIRTIGFAKYTARAQRRIDVKQPIIGMLVQLKAPEDLRLREACAYVAKDYGAAFYCFRPTDVRFHFPMVKGYLLHQGEWVPHYMPYPDIIYDRVKERGKKVYRDTYDKLKGIPFTEERIGGSLSKLKQYNLFKKNSRLSNHVIPYESLNDVSSALKFLNKHELVVIKPAFGSLGDKQILVEAVKDGYLVKDPDHLHLLDRRKLELLLTSLSEKKGYLIQQFVQSVTKSDFPFYIRMHLVKEQKCWKAVESLMYLSADPQRNPVHHSETFWVYSPLKRLLKHEYPNTGQIVEKKLEAIGLEVTRCLDEGMTDGLFEIGIDFGIGEDEHIWLFEANVNKVGVDYREMDIAKIVVPSALSQIGEA